MIYNDGLKPNEADNLDSPLDHLDELAVSPQPDPEDVLALLQSPDYQKRIAATRTFCELQDQRAIPHLISLLSDSCPMIRMSAAYALGRNPAPSAVEPLIQQLERDWNGYVRKGIVCALGNCGDARPLNPLIESLQNDIAAVRLWAASALGQMASIEADTIVHAIPHLIKSLQQDPVSVVRGNCAWALGQICRELPFNSTYTQIIDTLLEILTIEAEDLSVREDAKEALLKVGDPGALQRIEELQQDGLFW